MHFNIYAGQTSQIDDTVLCGNEIANYTVVMSTKSMELFSLGALQINWCRYKLKYLTLMTKHLCCKLPRMFFINKLILKTRG